MAIIVSFGLNIPTYKRATLFGQGIIPITIIGLGLITLIRMDKPHMALLNEMVKAGSEQEEFLVARTEQVMAYKKKVEKQAREDAQAKSIEDVQYWKDNYIKSHDSLSEAQQKIQRLEVTIRTLIEYRDLPLPEISASS